MHHHHRRHHRALGEHHARHHHHLAPIVAGSAHSPRESDAIFDMKTGKLYVRNSDGTLTMTVPAGSGLHEGHNNPNSINEKGIGAIPPGRYTVGSAGTHSLHVHGKQVPTVAMPLQALGNTHGRTGILIHPSHGYKGTESSLQSNGCIVVPPKLMSTLVQAHQKGLMRCVYVTADASRDPALQDQFSPQDASLKSVALNAPPTAASIAQPTV